MMKTAKEFADYFGSFSDPNDVVAIPFWIEKPTAVIYYNLYKSDDQPEIADLTDAQWSLIADNVMLRGIHGKKGLANEVQKVLNLYLV